MTNRTPHLVLLAVCAALVPVAAQAQWYDARSARPAGSYPYQVRPGQAYAVEVAPNTYVIHRPTSRNYPYVRYPAGWHHVAPRHVTRRHVSRRQFARGHVMRRHPATRHTAKRYVVRHGGKRIVINTKRIVREKPVVIEHRRVVDDPPRVVERRHYVEDVPLPRPRRHGLLASKAERRPPPARGRARVIRAEAEVTILGPDRMSIRLYRKGGGASRAFGKQ